MNRLNGFAPIEDYAVVGDGRTAALIARDGSVDWFPIPRLDAPPVLAALLDPDVGGHFRLAPDAPATVRRRYLPDTNVLESEYTCRTGVVRVVDALTLGATGPPPWTELVRRVEAVSGSVPMVWEFVPGSRFDHARPEVGSYGDTPVIRVGDQHLAVITDRAGSPEVTGDRVRGAFEARPGEDALIAVTASDDEPLHIPHPAHVRGRLEHTEQAWRYMAGRVRYDGPHREAVVRSALTLRLLFFCATGAFAAAVTTSLPECIGGHANFDYRYAWVRDSSFVMDALVRLGMWEETHAGLSFLLDAVANDGDVGVFYGLDGDRRPETAEVDLRGYRGSRPVRSGNSAVGQLQLANYGDLLDAVWHAASGGTLLDPDHAELVGRLADRVCERWREPDCGIWELPDRRHYTISKIGCWVALDRAVRLAEAGHLHRSAEKWAAERDTVREWIDEHCWSAGKGAYTMHAGTDDLDAAVLLAARTGYLSGDDPRLAGTVDAIRAELAHGPLLYRYTAARGHEGTFTPCAFWLVIALSKLGRRADAQRLLDELMGWSNDLGLMSEELDPDTGHQLGNTPQALSHLALINAMTTLHPVTRR